MWKQVKQFLKQKILPVLVEGIEIIDNLQVLDINENSILVLKTDKDELTEEKARDLMSLINGILPNRIIILSEGVNLVAILNPEPKKEVK